MKHSRRQRVIQKHLRIRKKIVGSLQKPRLSVYKSNNHIYAQIIDDSQGKTLLSSSTRSVEIKKILTNSSTCEASKLVGNTIGKLALEKGINNVIFDRGGYLFHGRVKALADGLRESGLIL
uniref:Large ribosomal subunit protein uL18c n=1 Tax=Porphyridium purpureum TaxID=35688 RepID=W0RYG5_PORPP|nr:chloroplast 50S ribosomal protein L18 [Porphyridium purpureum]ATJ02887.1 50S ribosomal protein L18 [Porphyridium purpureum]BAO23664.1 chloroplast 50S ribosomal protein L18 [Porphyridium purpureum]